MVLKKRLIIVMICAGFLFMASACATTGFLGLATTKYVDNQLSDSKRELEKLDREMDLAYEDYDENRKRLNDLEGEIRDLMTAKEELENLVTVIRQNEAATAELQDLADQVEGKLETIPDETLMLLADMINEYLEGSEISEP